MQHQLKTKRRILTKKSHSEDDKSHRRYVKKATQKLMENIGARRLHTVMETLLEEVSYHAPELNGKTITIDAKMVEERLGTVLKDEDLGRYIL